MAYTYVPALVEQIIAVVCVSNASDGEDSGNDSGKSDGGAGARASESGDCMFFFFNGVIFILL